MSVDDPHSAPFTPHAPRRSQLDPVSTDSEDEDDAIAPRGLGAFDGYGSRDDDDDDADSGGGDDWSAPAASPDARERGFDRDDGLGRGRPRAECAACPRRRRRRRSRAPPSATTRTATRTSGRRRGSASRPSKQASPRARHKAPQSVDNAAPPRSRPAHPLFFRAAAFCRTSAIHDERTSASNCSSRSTVIDWRS